MSNENLNGVGLHEEQQAPPPINQPAQQQISRIAMRAPPFWKENPTLWFIQLESQFFTNGITQSDTKYHIAVGALETAIINQVSDVVTNPPINNKYETLKQRLQERFTESEERRFKKLLGAIDMGDKLPSHLWREMRDLAGERVGQDLLKSLWLQRLQPHAQAILSSTDGDMTRVTAMADKIHEVIDTRGIHSVSQQKSTPSTSSASSSAPQSEINELRVQMRELVQQVAALAAEKSNFRSRSPNPKGSQQQRSRQRSKSRVEGQCWYHNRFGASSKKCTTPCSFPKEN